MNIPPTTHTAVYSPCINRASRFAIIHDCPFTFAGILNLSHPVPLAEFRSYVQSREFTDEFQV
jgi:hypothetical protein